MTIEFEGRVRHKKDTASNWTSANPILYAGELILVETNSGAIRLKVGDGSKRYSQLPFIDEELYRLLSERSTLLESDVEVTTDDVATIDIPSTLTGLYGLTVYHNGVKLSKDTNYTISSDNKSISLVEYTANTGDIFSFVSLQ